METLRDQTRAWVRTNYSGAQHLIRTEEWLLQLKPDAFEEMLLAALTHDMERAFPGPDSPVLDPRQGVDNPTYNMAHSERSARIVSAYLQEQSLPPGRIAQVVRFIRLHEYGGDADENLVQAADSLSFLEVNVDSFLNMLSTHNALWNADTVRAKFTWMYERIQIPHAHELARPMYEDAIRKLNENTPAP